MIFKSHKLADLVINRLKIKFLNPFIRYELGIVHSGGSQYTKRPGHLLVERGKIAES